VADAFDAMTSTRPYRDPLSKEAALNELVRYSGQQFDPSLVEVFLRVMEMCPMPRERSFEFRVSL